jgi:hypothetical protein
LPLLKYWVIVLPQEALQTGEVQFLVAYLFPVPENVITPVIVPSYSWGYTDQQLTRSHFWFRFSTIHLLCPTVPFVPKNILYFHLFDSFLLLGLFGASSNVCLCQLQKFNSTWSLFFCD